MAIRTIASLSLTFGLVSIPVKVYLATESSAAIKFKLMAASGARVRQQFVADVPAAQVRGRSTDEDEAALALPRAPQRGDVILPFHSDYGRPVGRAEKPEPQDPPQVIERAEMVKGYEFEKGRFVLFTADELKALEAESRQTIDIVSFIPEQSVDPIYFDKAYYLAPDKHGGKPYSLLRRAMQETHRCALARWAWRSKEYVVQIRPEERGMVLQQLLYADEVRSIDALGIELSAVGNTELRLAMQLIDQVAQPSYDPDAFVDEEKRRILAAVERKIAGKQIVTHGRVDTRAGADVVDLAAALRASLAKPGRRRGGADLLDARSSVPERKPARRAPGHSAAKVPKVRKG